MKYFNIIQANRDKEKPLRVEPIHWTEQQQKRIDEGRCVNCGRTPAAKSSFLCPGCEALSFEAVTNEIEAARNRTLNHDPKKR